MGEIPECVIQHEILPRLPVKSISRFKSVSKQWNEIMSTTQFIEAFYRLSSSLSKSVIATTDQAYFTLLDFGDYPEILYQSIFGTLFINIDTATYLVESCNGLVLLICSNRHSDNQNLKLPNHLLHFDYNFVIFNPVIGRNSCLQINHPLQFLVANNNNNNDNDNMELEAHDYNFGFGYVSSVDDYYIVAINFLSNPEIAVMHLYTFRTLEWRRREESRRFNTKFEEVWYNKSGILINENLHWGISISFLVGEIPIESYEIGVVDLANFGDPSRVVFRTMQLPQNNFAEARAETGGSGFSLCCLNGRLCAWGRYDNGRELDMWMMRQYGVHESWARLFRVNLVGLFGSGIADFFGYNRYEVAMILTYRDELMLASCNHYSPVQTHHVIRDQVKAVNYARSLVSPLALIPGYRE